jgi:hypothetical protein
MHAPQSICCRRRTEMCRYTGREYAGGGPTYLEQRVRHAAAARNVLLVIGDVVGHARPPVGAHHLHLGAVGRLGGHCAAQGGARGQRRLRVIPSPSGFAIIIAAPLVPSVDRRGCMPLIRTKSTVTPIQPQSLPSTAIPPLPRNPSSLPRAGRATVPWRVHRSQNDRHMIGVRRGAHAPLIARTTARWKTCRHPCRTNDVPTFRRPRGEGTTDGAAQCRSAPQRGCTCRKSTRSAIETTTSGWIRSPCSELRHALAPDKVVHRSREHRRQSHA